MTDNIRNCFTWFANMAAQSVLYKSWTDGYRLEELTDSYDKFIEFLSDRIDFKNLTVEEARELRFCRWDDDEPDLYLIPLYLAPAIPKGTELTSISGEKIIYNSIEDIYLDIRCGCLAYGITIKEDETNSD